jgi:TRAP-type C4-dicarboxylate transport system permease small subunit
MSTASDWLARHGAAGVAWDRAIRLSPIVMGLLLLVLGVPVVEISMRRELPTLQIPAGYFSTIVPASGALMIVYAARGFRPARGRGPGPSV